MKLISQTPSAELINEALDAVKNTETTSTVETGGHTLLELRTVIKVVQELRAKVQEVLAAAAARSDKAPRQHSNAERAPISNVRSQVQLLVSRRVLLEASSGAVSTPLFAELVTRSENASR